jgi:prepilin-type N-terminal cleavage/methylation domain-containing protein
MQIVKRNTQRPIVGARADLQTYRDISAKQGFHAFSRDWLHDCRLSGCLSLFDTGTVTYLKQIGDCPIGLSRRNYWIPAGAGMTRSTGSGQAERDCFARHKVARLAIKKKAFTLIEMLVVVAVLAILVTIVISVASRIDTQGKINSTQGTIAILNKALSEFNDYGFTYAAGSQYANLRFPIDCNNGSNGFSKTNTETALQNSMPDVTNVTINLNAGLTYDIRWSGTIAMYFLLDQIPQCRQTLEKLDAKSIVSAGTIDVTSGGVVTTYPLIYIVDAWSRPLGYKYYNFVGTGTTIDNATIKTFPVLTSAGPDGIFDTSDDVKSR